MTLHYARSVLECGINSQGPHKGGEAVQGHLPGQEAISVAVLDQDA